MMANGDEDNTGNGSGSALHMHGPLLVHMLVSVISQHLDLKD